MTITKTKLALANNLKSTKFSYGRFSQITLANRKTIYIYIYIYIKLYK